MSAGISLGLFTILIMLLAIGVHPFTRRVTNTYWFWLAYGIFVFVLITVYRWGPDISDLLNSNKAVGILWSKALLLDMCPMTAVAIHIAVIVDPTRKGAKAIAPMAIFGGMITIFGQVMTGSSEGAEWSYKYLFEGIAPNRAYFLIHFFNLITGVLVLLNTTKFSIKTYSGEYIVNAGYFMYVAICIYASHGVIDCNVTGLLIKDWDAGGEYAMVAQVLNCSPVVAMIVGYTACILAVNAIIGVQVLVQKAKPYQISNKHNKNWYKGLNGWYHLVPYSKNKYLRVV